jgi:hypothetical protein
MVLPRTATLFAAGPPPKQAAIGTRTGTAAAFHVRVILFFQTLVGEQGAQNASKACHAENPAKNSEQTKARVGDPHCAKPAVEADTQAFNRPAR